VTTYSEALTQATTFIVYAVAIALTIPALGFSLAGAGILGIAATYVFKPKVDNVINGVVILWSDRYAVGDVIQIGDRAGLVENLNLYMTELRGDGGRLISIPNGSIDIVENLTKEWSRVEVAIELAYSTDVERALEILKTVAEQMQQEPEWDEKILEPASIFGLDSMTYDGLLVQIWVKTAPMQQWSVARELRVRVKQAFDREGIALGMPQRSLFLRQEAILGKREEGEK
jgi:small conductance mechanosensitive channel